MSVRDLERVLYYESYVVIDPGNTGLKNRELLDRGRSTPSWPATTRKNKFLAKMGAEAIRDLLAGLELDELAAELRTVVKIETQRQRKKETLKRLRVVEAFRQSGNKPEWMILEVVPVLPPDLRPLVPLEGGRFATCDLNDLYRRVINRNNRLKKLMEIKAPEVILRNEKRMLQEAVDALFDNGRRSPRGARPGQPAAEVAVRHAQGQAGALPPEPARQARRLLGPLGDRGRSRTQAAPVRSAQDRWRSSCSSRSSSRTSRTSGFVSTVKSAKRLVERETPEVWDILGEIIKDHPVHPEPRPHAAPSRHPGVRAGAGRGQGHPHPPAGLRRVQRRLRRRPDGRARAARRSRPRSRATELMLSTNNILSPANGRPLATPSQDIVLGVQLPDQARGRCPKAARSPGVFSDREEVRGAYDHGAVCAARAGPACGWTASMVDTTVGRVIFNEVAAARARFREREHEQEVAGGAWWPAASGCSATGRRPSSSTISSGLGFEYATKAGITVGIDDIVIPEEKQQHHRQGARPRSDDIRRQVPRRRHHRRRALQQGHRHLDPRHQRGGGGHLQRPAPGPGRLQPDLHDGRLGIARLQGADPPAGRHARPHGPAAEEDHRRHRRNHREPGHPELQGRADRARVLHLHPRRPQGSGRHGARRPPTPAT